MLIVSLGGLVFAIVAAKPVVVLFFGHRFESAASTLPVLAAAFILICFGYINSNILVAIDMQRRLLWISSVALIVNIVGNLILIPQIGYIGAAWMTVATEAVVYLAMLFLIGKVLPLPLPSLSTALRAASAALLLYGALELVAQANGAALVLGAIAAVLYPLLVLGAGAVRPREVKSLLLRQTG